jgi:hypothetical protein
MSNIALFQSGSVIPDYLRAQPDATTKDIAGSSGGKQISIKGGVWRMVVGGEEVAKNEDRAMNFVIVASGKGVSRTYYAEKYEEGKDIKPACWSAEGVKPEAEVVNPQSTACATCPQNIEGSGEGKARACRYSKRLAVALEHDIGGNIYRLSVPAKSYFGKADGEKMPLQAFGKFLAGHGIPITGIVTEARFDTSEAVPVMKFRALRPLSQEEWALAKAQSVTEDAKNAIDFKMVPSKAETGTPPALPQAFKEAPVAAVEAPATPEPTKRAKKAEAAPTPATKDVSAILDQWADDGDD